MKVIASMILYDSMKRSFLLLLLVCFWGCENASKPEQLSIKCDPDNGGLTLPDGFCALVVADHINFLRHITVTRNGDIYGSRRNRRLELGGLVAIRDENGDGKADIVHEFGDEPGLGVTVHEGFLYFGADKRILRFPLDDLELVPEEEPQIIDDGFPDQQIHAGKTFAIDDQGQMYINVGSTSNACQKK